VAEWRCGCCGNRCLLSFFFFFKVQRHTGLRFSLYLFYFYFCSSYSVAFVLFLPSWLIVFSFFFLSSSFPLPCFLSFLFCLCFLPVFFFFSPPPLSSLPLDIYRQRERGSPYLVLSWCRAGWRGAAPVQPPLPLQGMVFFFFQCGDRVRRHGLH